MAKYIYYPTILLMDYILPSYDLFLLRTHLVWLKDIVIVINDRYSYGLFINTEWICFLIDIAIKKNVLTWKKPVETVLALKLFHAGYLLRSIPLFILFSCFFFMGSTFDNSRYCHQYLSSFVLPCHLEVLIFFIIPDFILIVY